MSDPGDGAGYEAWGGVAMLHWPRDAEIREVLAAAGRPRLLLIPHGEVPPPSRDNLEDWMWEPGDGTELAVRVEHLALRARHGPPRIDQSGTFHYGNQVVLLTPQELLLARVLVDHFDLVVPRPALQMAGWGDDDVRPKALHVTLHRIRRRISPLGLSITAIRRRGFVMHRSGDKGRSSRVR